LIEENIKNNSIAFNKKQQTIEYIQKMFRSLYKSKLGMMGLVIMVFVTLVAIFAPLIAPYNPADTDYNSMFLPPFWQEGGNVEHILGTDNLGRDVLSRIIYGSRISLIVGVLSVVLSGFLGVTLGLVSGYKGGIVDNIIMRLVDSFLSIPSILFMLVIL